MLFTILMIKRFLWLTQKIEVEFFIAHVKELYNPTKWEGNKIRKHSPRFQSWDACCDEFV
ncbi:hypothetical protein EV144_105266 [Flavobacterium sp. 270]|nr:hypothetical protein EV144_105266 [Flavobacterium sp. 270]